MVALRSMALRKRRRSDVKAKNRGSASTTASAAGGAARRFFPGACTRGGLCIRMPAASCKIPSLLHAALTASLCILSTAAFFKSVFHLLSPAIIWNGKRRKIIEYDKRNENSVKAISWRKAGNGVAKMGEENGGGVALARRSASCAAA